VLLAALAVAAGVALAWWTYAALLDRSALRWAALARALAVALIVALLLDVPAGRVAPRGPLVALDVSSSWLRARDSADFRAAATEARQRADGDTLWLVGQRLRAASGSPDATDARSSIAPLVERAQAAGRPVILFTDGELDDPDAAGRLPAGSVVERRPAPLAPDAAVRGLEAPRIVVAGDTAEVVVRIGAGAAGAPAGALRLAVETRDLALIPVAAFEPWEERELRAVILPPAEGPPSRALRAVLTLPGDVEPRNDTLTAVLEVAALPLAVVVSTAPDQDIRFALDVLRGTLALPTRAYVRVAPGQWRQEPGLTRVSEAAVREALVEAPFAVLHGDTALFGAPRSITRGALALLVPAPSAEAAEAYVGAAPRSPLSPAYGGVPWDSLPPITPGLPARGAWTGLSARRAGGGALQPVVAGDDQPRRTVTVSGSGMWRWAFRGGSSADAHQAFWGGVFDWLVAGGDDPRSAVPTAAVLREGEPVRWRRGAGQDTVVRVVLRATGAAPDAAADTLTLRFAADAAIAVSDPLPRGDYTGTLERGAVRLIVSAAPEWLPRRPPTLSAPSEAVVAAGAPRSVRDLWWMYVAALLLLCGEWVMRRRAGLR